MRVWRSGRVACSLILISRTVFRRSIHPHKAVTSQGLRRGIPPAFCVQAALPLLPIVNDTERRSDNVISISKRRNTHVESNKCRQGNLQLFGLELARSKPRLSRQKRLELDYDVRIAPRWGYRVEPNRHIERAIAANQALYARTLDGFLRHRNALSAIPYDSFADDPCSPHWSNLFFSGLDAASLVCFILARIPRMTHCVEQLSRRFRYRCQRLISSDRGNSWHIRRVNRNRMLFGSISTAA